MYRLSLSFTPLTLVHLCRPIGDSSGSAGSERLREIGNDVVNVFRADGDTDSVVSDTGILTFLLGELFVSSGPGVDCEGLGVTDAVHNG